MKRALAAALTAAIFMTLLVGMASAEVTANDEPVATRSQDSDQVHDFSIRRLLIKCWRVVHSHDADPTIKHRCEKILKRWCASHPDSRLCHRPPPPPNCRSVDRLTDVRGVIVDRLTDVKCVPIDRPIDKPTDRPTDQPSDQSTDQPTDQPTDRPTDQPTDRPTDQPTDKPVDTRPVKDGIRDGSDDRLADKTKDDAYVRANSADL